jgi:hypothetical protein
MTFDPCVHPLIKHLPGRKRVPGTVSFVSLGNNNLALSTEDNFLIPFRDFAFSKVIPGQKQVLEEFKSPRGGLWSGALTPRRGVLK